jgi:hypothetical protein
MATAFGFDIGTAAQGAVFALTAAVKNDRTHTFPTWEAELRRGLSHLCVRGGAPEDKPLETIVAAAHPFAEDALDIVSVEERLAFLVSEPHDCLVWRRGAHGLKAQLTTSITFAAEPLAVRAVVKDAQGDIVPDPPYVPPEHHAAYRYFRYSQAASNVFDAYRNMFLALESALDHVASKQHGEGETSWLARALRTAIQQHRADLTPFVKVTGKDPVDSFIDAHYAAVRCAIFHAKNSGGGALRPGTLEDRDLVLQQLLMVQKLVEGLLKNLFGVRLPSGGIFHSGFGHMLEQLAPVIHLLIGPTDCPTVEQLLANDENLPEGVVGPVRFQGLRSGTTDEWLFVSEIKCRELPFTHLGALRLIAHVNDRSRLGAMGMFLIPIMDKMNRTLLHTDLDLASVNKLVIRVRCVLRNAQEARRGFAS